MAKQFKVAVTEYLRKIVTVEAETESEAHKRVSDAWQNGEYLLDGRDFDGAEFFVIGEADEDSVGNLERVDGKNAGVQNVY